MKKLCAFLCLMCLTAALSVPASAAGPLEYSIDATGRSGLRHPHLL